MRIPRLFVDHQLEVSKTLELAPASSHYLVQVLRLKEGDKLRPFNEGSGEFIASIVQAHRKHCVIIVETLSEAPSNLGFKVHLGLGLSKGDRMDIAIQKATELGVAEITPLSTEFSEMKFNNDERKLKKLTHWRNIATSAAEQCGRLSVPKINDPKAIYLWMEEAKEELKLMLSPRATSSFTSLSQSSNCALLVGPEGGLSETEENRGEELSFKSLSLGRRVLRTETAPIAALAILQFQFGDMS